MNGFSQLQENKCTRTNKLTQDQEFNYMVSALRHVFSGADGRTDGEAAQLLREVQNACMHGASSTSSNSMPRRSIVDTHVQPVSAATYIHGKNAIEYRGDKAKTNFPISEYAATVTENKELVEVLNGEVAVATDHNIINGESSSMLNGDDFWDTLEDDGLVKWIKDMSL
ncbi:hypothetical protein K7X08_019459 [Anisodus acutangulus]|uniref:Uncharacterized protein n=1 Tax=Anisodus acutangulus TaxID=402998 RepID=A0A9Q1MSG0_9SOLA|nr:hypothetical protein K7X08_019459 [Anisodus acutangulus]